MANYQPAFLGGVFIGVLSALPAIQTGNCCCCLWVVIGGMLTTYIQQQRTALPLGTSDAVVQGLLAGVIGGVLAGILDLILAPFIGPLQQRIAMSMLEYLQQLPDLPAESRGQLEEALRQPANEPVLIRLGRSALFVPIAAVFAMLGSFLGLAFFRKKTPAQPQV